MVLRGALILGALLLAGWLAAGLRSAERQEAGLRLALAEPGRLEPAAVARARGHYRDARTWVPDGQPRYLEGALLVRHGRRAEGLAVLEALVRDEPAHALAWLAIAQNAASPAQAARARARVLALAPPVPAPGG